MAISPPTASNTSKILVDSLIKVSAALPTPRDARSGKFPIAGGLHRGCGGYEESTSGADVLGWRAGLLQRVGGGRGRAGVEEGGTGTGTRVIPSGSLRSNS